MKKLFCIQVKWTSLSKKDSDIQSIHTGTKWSLLGVSDQPAAKLTIILPKYTIFSKRNLQFAWRQVQIIFSESYSVNHIQSGIMATVIKRTYLNVFESAIVVILVVAAQIHSPIKLNSTSSVAGVM